MSPALVVRPFAKINLTLRVGPRRADGFHDIRTMMQSIALTDRLTFTARRGPLVLDTRGPGVSSDRTNLVWRAADVLWRALRRAGDPRDLHIRLDKSIPPAAGLGGGSADAAATLVALNQMWAGRKSRRALAALAAELGGDVPFFLFGGTALAAGRGEEIYPLEDVGRLGVVLIKPSFGVSTAEAYRWLDEDRASRSEAPAAVRELDLGWPPGPITLINDLQGPVARRHPEVAEMIDACIEAGARGAAMTGSGSAVFGVFPDSVAARAVRRLQRPDWLVIASRTLTRREAARKIRL